MRQSKLSNIYHAIRTGHRVKGWAGAAGLEKETLDCLRPNESWERDSAANGAPPGRWEKVLPLKGNL